jgi:transcriptional regulator with XRE-family HTH domain
MPMIIPAYRDTQFAFRLRQIMREKKVTCRKLGDALKISHASIGNYRSGKCEPDIELIAGMCKYLNVSADWLLGISEVRKGL